MAELLEIVEGVLNGILIGAYSIIIGTCFGYGVGEALKIFIKSRIFIIQEKEGGK